MVEEPAGEPVAPVWQLRRSRDGRVLAGVCGAFGRHTDIDPLVYRVAFALLTVANGLGVVLYLMAWLFIPGQYAAASPAERILRRRIDPQVVFPLSLLILVLCLVPTGLFERFVLLAVLLVGVVAARARGVDVIAAVRTLPAQFQSRQPPHRQQQHPPAQQHRDPPGAPVPWWSLPTARPRRPPGPPGAPPHSPQGGPASPTPPRAPTAPYPTAPYPTAPYPTAPYPTAPYPTAPPAGPQPEPGPLPAYGSPATTPPAVPGHSPAFPGAAPPARVRRRQRERTLLTPLTLAAAIGVAGILALLGGAGVISAPLPLVLSAALVTIGLGLALGTWYSRGPMLVVIGLAVSIALVASTIAIDASAPFRVGFGDITWRPTSAREAAQQFQLGAGKGSLLLTDLPSRRGAYDVDADVGAGVLRVVIPADATVGVDAHIGSGAVRVPGRTRISPPRTRGGTLVHTRYLIPPAAGTDGGSPGRDAGGDPLRINFTLRVGAGEVVIVRAPT